MSKKKVGVKPVITKKSRNPLSEFIAGLKGEVDDDVVEGEIVSEEPEKAESKNSALDEFMAGLRGEEKKK